MMKETLGSLLMSLNSVRIEQDVLGQAIINVIAIQTLGGDTINDNVYKLTLETHKALSSTS